MSLTHIKDIAMLNKTNSLLDVALDFNKDIILPWNPIVFPLTGEVIIAIEWVTRLHLLNGRNDHILFNREIGASVIMQLLG